MAEEGVNIINGTDGSVAPSRGTVSRSQSPNSRKSVNGEDEEKPKKFQNGWSREQERLMAEWSDIASCYRWLHDKSEKFFHTKTLWINLPVIVLSTLGGTANFGIQSLFENDENAKKYASFAIGGISLFAGLLTTVGNYLRYAQLEESHRVAAIAWGKFQRLIAVELALKPDDRMDSLDFLKICRADLDRLIEQSPPIPKESIVLFEKKFGTIKDLKKPDICGALEHTHVFESSETRLKQAAVEAALMLRRRKQTLNELLTPQIENRINAQIDTRLSEAIETRKKTLEVELEQKRIEAEKSREEYERALADRKRKIEEEIELEKKKLFQEPVHQSQALGAAVAAKMGGSQFESRLNYRRTSLANIKLEPMRKTVKSQQLPNPGIYAFETGEAKNKVITPEENQKTTDDALGNSDIVIISK
jgi:hypothetical protein